MEGIVVFVKQSLDPQGDLFADLLASGLSEEMIMEVISRCDFSEYLSGLVRSLYRARGSEDLQQELVWEINDPDAYLVSDEWRRCY